MTTDYDFDVTCPSCGAVHDGAMSIGHDEGPPDDGSIGVCIDCVAVYCYDSTQPGGARLLEDDELAAEMSKTPDLFKAVLAVRRAHMMRKADRGEQ